MKEEGEDDFFCLSFSDRQDRPRHCQPEHDDEVNSKLPTDC